MVRNTLQFINTRKRADHLNAVHKEAVYLTRGGPQRGQGAACRKQAVDGGGKLLAKMGFKSSGSLWKQGHRGVTL